MQRGVYFDAWFPRQHCYHPSLPPRRLRMIDDLRDYHATVLVWAAMGGGSLSLPYLEEEAHGDVPARARFYGVVNDAEFVAECAKAGIVVFGIVFEAQGWEFPVELDEDETTVLSLNELRGVGRRGWLGLREFSSHRYPKLWPPLEHYFPAGLQNSAGERVTDLIEECGVRDIHQQLCHAHWVECPDREHQCYYMDRNNPVWREYLKAVIRIQIDAGVHGIQLDEAELPLGALQYGACFCRDCMLGFRSYLLEQPADRLPPELARTDLTHFHYGEWLLSRGHDFTDPQHTPLFGAYYAFQCRTIAGYFGELATYARDYGRQQGRTVLVSGNFFNMDPQYLGLREHCDLLITEMRNTTYRQPQWYRYVAGFAGDKDVVVVENPYGGVVPDLVDQLQVGRGHDLFRLSLLEAAAFGANMSVPYGSWMGSRIQDAYYAPHEVAKGVQAFLAEHDALFSKQSYAEVAVVYCVAGNRDLVAQADASDNIENARDESVQVPYRVVTGLLAQSAVPFDVVIFPDGVTSADHVTVVALAPYDTVLLPTCDPLTDSQLAAVHTYVDGGGTAVSIESPGLDVPQMLVADMNDLRALLPRGPQLVVDQDVAAHVHRLPDGSAAVHLVNFGYDAKLDRVPLLEDVDVVVRLPMQAPTGHLLTLAGPSTALAVTTVDGEHRFRLNRLGVYAIVHLTERET